MLCQAVTSPGEALPIVFFLLVMSWVRLGLALERPGSTSRWERDLTTRKAG
jgi:hypothetical protein